MKSLTLLFALLTYAAIAHGAPNLSACRQIADDAERLKCYDAAVDAVLQPITVNPVAAAKTEATADAPSPPPISAVSGETIFGKVGPTDTAVIHEVFGVPDIDAIESTITEARKEPDGRRVFALANGQVWAQVDRSNLALAVGDTVRIRRAMIGSFLLGTSSSKKTMRVNRID